jgi:hypothetical protein
MHNAQAVLSARVRVQARVELELTVLACVAGGTAARVGVEVAHTSGVVRAQVAHTIVHTLLAVLAREAARTAAALFPARAAVVAAAVAVQAVGALGVD